MVSSDERIDHAAVARNLLTTEASGGTATENLQPIRHCGMFLPATVLYVPSEGVES